MASVVNLHHNEYDVYIGRAGRGEDGYFGNPFNFRATAAWPHHDVARAGSLWEYRKYFLYRIETDPEFKERILALRGKRLGCFCKPKECHGAIIVEWLKNNQ